MELNDSITHIIMTQIQCIYDDMRNISSVTSFVNNGVSQGGVHSSFLYLIYVLVCELLCIYKKNIGHLYSIFM